MQPRALLRLTAPAARLFALAAACSMGIEPSREWFDKLPKKAQPSPVK